DVGLQVAQHTIAVDEGDGVVILEAEGQALRVVEIVFAGDAMKEVDAVRAAAQPRGGPRVAVDVEIEPLPLDTGMGEKTSGWNQRTDAVLVLAGIPERD